jgi:hypothetical protein
MKNVFPELVGSYYSLVANASSYLLVKVSLSILVL